MATFSLFLSAILAVAAAQSGTLFRLSFDELSGSAAGSRVEIKDSSPNQRRGFCKPNVCPKFGVPGKFGKAVSFSGQQILETQGIWFEEGTVSMWYRVLGASTGNRGSQLVRPHGGVSGANNDLILTGSPTFALGRVFDNPGWFATSAADIPTQSIPSYAWGGFWCDRYWMLPTSNGGDNTWQQVVFVFIGNSVSIYYRGKLEGTLSTTLCKKNIQFIGGRSINADYMNGEMDEFAVYSKPLTAAEIASMQTAPLIL